MRTNFLSTSFLNTPRGPEHPGKIPGTSQIPLFETQGRQTFEGEHEVFGRHPFARKTPTRPGGLWTTKKLIFVLFFSSMMNQRCVLSDPTEIPPYRETGVAIPLSHCISCGIADYRCYTPTSFRKDGLSQAKDRPNKGGIAEKAYPWNLSRYRGGRTR